MINRDLLCYLFVFVGEEASEFLEKDLPEIFSVVFLCQNLKTFFLVERFGFK